MLKEYRHKGFVNDCQGNMQPHCQPISKRTSQIILFQTWRLSDRTMCLRGGGRDWVFSKRITRMPAYRALSSKANVNFDSGKTLLRWNVNDGSIAGENFMKCIHCALLSPRPHQRQPIFGKDCSRNCVSIPCSPALQ